MKKWNKPIAYACSGACIGLVIVVIWYFSSVFPYDTMGYGALGALAYGFWAVLIGFVIGLWIGWPR